MALTKLEFKTIEFACYWANQLTNDLHDFSRAQFDRDKSKMNYAEYSAYCSARNAARHANWILDNIGITR